MPDAEEIDELSNDGDLTFCDRSSLEAVIKEMHELHKTCGVDKAKLIIENAKLQARNNLLKKVS